MPYDKEPTTMLRRMSMCGTTNDHDFLKDLTGTRRYPTLTTTKLNTELKINYVELWGYIYDCYLRDERYWFTLDEISKIEVNNSKYIAKPAELLCLESVFDLTPALYTGEWLTAKEMYNLSHEFATLFDSNYKFAQRLKKFKLIQKYDSARKTNLYFVKKRPSS
jgi:hypothetical protein